MIKHIKIGGHKFKVKVDKSLTPEEGSPAHILPWKNEIHISPYMAKSGAEEALLHEVIEGINTRFQLKLNHPQITTLSESLYQVLKDNPGLMKR